MMKDEYYYGSKEYQRERPQPQDGACIALSDETCATEDMEQASLVSSLRKYIGSNQSSFNIRSETEGLQQPGYCFFNDGFFCTCYHMNLAGSSEQ